MTTDTERDRVDELLKRIETGPWTITRYEACLDDPVSVSLSVEYDESDQTETVDDETEDMALLLVVREAVADAPGTGIHTTDVVERVAERTGADDSRIIDAIDELRVRGEIYEPNPGRLKVT